MKTLTELHDAAEKITEFGRQFGRRSYSVAAKAWKFDPDCALASVHAFVCDEDGSIDRDQVPVGEPSLHLDIERFRHDKTPANADAAEAEVLTFARSLGFTVEGNGDGSGEYGRILCYLLK